MELYNGLQFLIMKYIITEGQLNHLLEVIQTGANNVTIVGSTLTLGSGKYDKSYFVKKPIIIYGGQGKLTLNDLSQLYEIIIKIGEDELKFDMTEYACKNMNITKFGDLQIPAYCVYKDPKNSEDPKNRDIANKIISRQEESKLSGNISSVVGGNVFNKLNSLGSWLEVKEGLNLKEFVNNILSGITNNIDCHKNAVDKNKTQITVQTISLNDLLDSYNAPTFIDYLSLDTEGSELEILKSVNFNKYKFGLIDIEHNYIEPRRTEIRKLLNNNNYIYIRENKFDDCYKYNLK
jgi:hypothetical protein